MESAQHTPGPWTSAGRGVFAGDVLICEAVWKADIDEYNEATANAALIAATPETARKLAEAEARIAELEEALAAAEPHLRSGDETLYRKCQMARYGLCEEDIIPMHLCV